MPGIPRHIVSEFPFWEHSEFLYSDLDRLFVRDDLIAVHCALAQQIAACGVQGKPVRWLDVGSGDGSTIAGIARFLSRSDHRGVLLDCVEPYDAAISQLRANLRQSNVVLGNIVQAHIADAILPRRYDIITCIHSSYYFGVTPEEYILTWLRLKSQLDMLGVIAVLALPSSSPFFRLAAPTEYCGHGKAEMVSYALAELFGSVEVKRLRVRIPTRQFTIQSSQDSLRQLYAFLHHTSIDIGSKATELLRAHACELGGDSKVIDMNDDLIVAPARCSDRKVLPICPVWVN